MANENDSRILQCMMFQPEALRAEFFRRYSHKIQDDSAYWVVLGSLWKAGGTVIQQDLWREMFLSPRRNRHKVMKTKERSIWRRLPKTVKAYRAINHKGEIGTAISWTLSRKVAEQFSQNGKREIVSREFKKSEVYAYFDRRNEKEILVNLTAKDL